MCQIGGEFRVLVGGFIPGIFLIENYGIRLALLTSCSVYVVRPENHVLTDRRPSTADCPACWAVGTEESKYCTVRKKYKYRHDKPNKPTKKGPKSFVLCESPFTSVSKVSRGHPILVS